MRRRQSALLLLIFLICLFVYNTFYQGKAVQNQAREETVVSNVVDGDTIVISGGERVRLLGMDTPEKGEFFYKEAKQRLEQLIEKRNVTLEKEGDNKDKYDRLLRYVFIDSVNVNMQMVEEGYANCYFYEKSRYQELCRGLEDKARSEKIGLSQQK
jgi:micrococcal nuclease